MNGKSAPLASLELAAMTEGACCLADGECFEDFSRLASMSATSDMSLLWQVLYCLNSIVETTQSGIGRVSNWQH